jgi:hypothetical protein
MWRDAERMASSVWPQLASEKFEYRSPVDLAIGDAIYRWPVMSIYAPSNAHHSPMVRCTPRRFEVISSGSIGLVIHPVTSRLRTLGRAIGSGASTRLASEPCCCSLVRRTNRLVALSSKPVLHWRQGDSLFVVSPGAPPFSHHPNCRNFSALADAIAAIVAMQTAARGYSASISGTNSP